MRWIYGTVIFGAQPIIVPHQPIALGATSEVHWFYGGQLIYIIHDFLGMNHTTHSKNLPTPRVTYSEITVDLDSIYVITISQQIHIHDLPGTNDSFVAILIFFPVVDENLHSPTTISRLPRTNDNLRTIQIPSYFPIMRSRDQEYTSQSLPTYVPLFSKRLTSIVLCPTSHPLALFIPEKHHDFFGFTKTVKFGHENIFQNYHASQRLCIRSRTNLRRRISTIHGLIYQ